LNEQLRSLGVPLAFRANFKLEIFILQPFTLHRTNGIQGMAFANWTKVVVSLNAAT
jgi:hypothetical protein